MKNSPSLYYNPSISISAINRIMDWMPDLEAEKILYEARERKEAEDGDAVRTDE